jgi:hypothetical protein
MASYSIVADAWTAQIDAILANIEDAANLYDELVDNAVFPILARHYDSSGLKVRSGVLKAAISKRGAFGNVFQKSPSRIVVGVSYTDISYAQAQIEGAEPHDIPNAFGRGAKFGIGGRFQGKFHPGNAPHPLYVLSSDEIKEIELELDRLVLARK